MATSKEFFTTEQVVELLGLKAKDKWRIIKFVEGKEYGIEPAMVMGKGLGSRRLYDLENVCQIAVALALLEAGLRPAVIGEALRRLGSMAHQLRDEDSLKNLYVLITLEQRFGRLLSKNRFVLSEFTNHFLTPEVIDQETLPTMRTGKFAVLYVPIESLFRGIKRKIELMKSSE